MASVYTDPVTGLPVSVATVLNGGTIPLGAMALVSTSGSAPTINAPAASPDGAGFAVRDVDGNASTNPITVSGNGHTIDGGSTCVLDVDGIEASFVFDGAEWTRVVPVRRFDSAASGYSQLVARAVDLPAAPGGLTGIDLESNGTPVTGGPFHTINVVGPSGLSGVAGVATLVPGLEVLKSGVDVVAPPVVSLNITRGTTSSPGAGAVDFDPTVTELQNAGSPLAGGPFHTLDLVGATAADAGSGVATVTVSSPSNAPISLLDLDLSALPNQTFATDGAYTVGGLAWTKQNSAGDAAAAAIVNGSGMRFQPAASTDYNGGTYSCPIMGTRLDLSLAATNYTYALFQYLRCTIWVQASNAAASFDAAIAGINSLSTGYGAIVKRGFGLGGEGFSTFCNVNGSNLGFVDQALTLGSSNNTIVIDVPIVGDTKLLSRYGQYSAGFPALSALSTSRLASYTSATVISSVTPTSLNLVLGAQRSGSGTALSITFGRIKVELVR